MTEQNMQNFDEQLDAFLEKRKELDAEFAALREQAHGRICSLITKFGFTAEELFPKRKPRRPRRVKADEQGESDAA